MNHTNIVNYSRSKYISIDYDRLSMNNNESYISDKSKTISMSRNKHNSTTPPRYKTAVSNKPESHRHFTTNNACNYNISLTTIYKDNLSKAFKKKSNSIRYKSNKSKIDSNTYSKSYIANHSYNFDKPFKKATSAKINKPLKYEYKITPTFEYSFSKYIENIIKNK